LLAKAEEKLSARCGCVNLARMTQALLGDTEWAKSIFRKADTYCTNWVEYDDLFRAMEQASGDKELLMEAHRNAEGKLGFARDLTSLAESILRRFSDTDWARRVYQAAAKAGDADAYRYQLASSLANKLDDRPWARRLLAS